MRNTFINTLCTLAKTNHNIFLLCGDLGYSVLEPFSEAFPERYLNVGIAEQNMTQVAAGLAKEGYNVFTYSIGNFPTLRCIEQIRYDVCYHNLNVKIVSIGAGYAYGPQGVSHHTTEDIGMIRTIPGITICSPADAYEAAAAADFMVNHNGPGYIRINKSGEPSLHSSKISLQPGCFIKVKEGFDTIVIGTGAIVFSVYREIIDGNLPFALYSAPMIGNYNFKELIDISIKFKNIITIEEHQLNSGFGSSVVEAYSDLFASNQITCMPKIHRIGIKNEFYGQCGTQEYLREIARLNLASLKV
jgi:transketolase